MNTLSLLLLILSASAEAHPARECAIVLDPPPVIRRSAQPFYPIELKGPEGRIFEYGEHVPHLDTGTWLFLVTKSRQLLLVPKYHIDRFLRDGRGLATHKTLLKAYAAYFHLPIQEEIVAAGEFVMSFGQVSLIRNKAGNFRAGEVNFDFGIAILKHAGVKFAKDYVKVVLDPAIRVEKPDEDDPFDHTKKKNRRDLHRLELMMEVRQHHHGADLVRLYKQLGRVMVEIYGNGAGSGGALKLMELSRGMRLPGRFQFFWPLTTASEFTGLDFGILGSMHKLKNDFPNPDEVWWDKMAPKLIGMVLQDDSVARTPAQDFLLRQIATEFQAIRYQPGEEYPNPVDENE